MIPDTSAPGPTASYEVEITEYSRKNGIMRWYLEIQDEAYSGTLCLNNDERGPTRVDWDVSSVPDNWEAIEEAVTSAARAHLARQEECRLEVVVGNIGTVCVTSDREEAERVFAEYCALSKQSYGRAAGEPVGLFDRTGLEKDHLGARDE